ncbi:MAG TPA: type II toxin-antitoxin system VapB family antitoxin [Phycisphaerae bacterium]|jgi:antitoxin VapB
MLTAKVFKNGRSQAVRLPKDFRFKGKKVAIAKIGGAVVLYPAEKAWDIMQYAVDHFTDDFMASRDQPTDADKRRSL